MGKCKFVKAWLHQDDSQGLKIRDWGQEHDEEHVRCTICEVLIKISNKGFQALTQHASSLKHKHLVQVKLSSNQLRLKGAEKPISATEDESSQTKTMPVRTLQVCSTKDRQTAAELIWTLKCVASNYSFASCTGLSETFKAMWGDDVIGNFTLGRTKIQYLITDALAPYFKDQLQHDIEDGYFTLIHNETTNGAGKSELLTAVRYWSKRHSRIVYSHLKAFFTDSGIAETICEKISHALGECSLQESKLLMIGSDGPNVNKSVFKKMNDVLVESRKKQLINIGTCNMHIIHNSFMKGLKELGENVQELVFCIHRFFHQWPKRWAAYREIQQKNGLPFHTFLKHCSNRWLSLKPAAERLLEQWVAVMKYFLEYIPQKKSTLMESPAYLKIARLLKKHTIKAEVILFVISSGNLFSHVLEFLQRKEPLIYKLYSQLEILIKTIFGRIYKEEFLRELSIEEIEDVCQEKLLHPYDMIAGDELSNELQKVKEYERKLFLVNAQKHYIACIKHLLKKSAVNSPLLKSLSCLDPVERLSRKSFEQIVNVARAMPWEVPIDLLYDEWRLLQTEKEVPILKPIDVYWDQFFKMRDISGTGAKYPIVSKVVKAALTLSHGSADIERDFSSSGRILTEDRASMSERTLDALMTVRSALSHVDYRPNLVPITSKLLDLGRAAYKAYSTFLEDLKQKEKEKLEKERKEREEIEAEKKNLEKLQNKRKIIAEEERKVKIMRVEEDEKLESASKLLSEANARLKKALKGKDFKEVAVAQAMIEGATKVSENACQQWKILKSAQFSVEKKKTKLISEFFNKKKLGVETISKENSYRVHSCAYKCSLYV